MNLRFLLIMALVFLCPVSSQAVMVPNLYQTSVPVADESAGARLPALQQALQQVLIKLSGNQTIAIQPGAAELISNAQQYVQKFRYSQSASETNVEPVLELLVKFDETALNNMMRSYGLTLWGRQRPAVLAWLAYDGPTGRGMLTFEEQPELLQALEQTAEARGIPLIFPLMDLEDNARLGISDIWGGFRQPIIEASERYQSDAVLVGRVSQAGGGLWQTNWSLFIASETLGWTTEADAGGLAVEEAINELADALADRFANTGSSGAEMFQLTVTNIDSNDDYARALSYLESLQSVTQVMVKTVAADTVIFELVNHGGAAALDQAIQLGRVLQPIAVGGQHRYRFQEGY